MACSLEKSMSIKPVWMKLRHARTFWFGVRGGERGVVVFAQRNVSEKFGRVSSSQSRAIRVKENIILWGSRGTQMCTTLIMALGVISTYNWLIFLARFI